MKLDIEKTRQHYEGLGDHKIIKIAKYDTQGLREEVVPILIKEIKKRNLGNNLIQWVKADSRKLSKEELAEIKKKIKDCICTNCKINRQLKGYIFTTYTGILIRRLKHHYTIIVCENCGNKRRRKSMISTAIFGWWSAKGIFSNLFILIGKFRDNIKENQISEELIEQFIKENIGLITLGNDNKNTIRKLINKLNKEDSTYDDDVSLELALELLTSN